MTELSSTENKQYRFTLSLPSNTPLEPFYKVPVETYTIRDPNLSDEGTFASCHLLKHSSLRNPPSYGEIKLESVKGSLCVRKLKTPYGDETAYRLMIAACRVLDSSPHTSITVKTDPQNVCKFMKLGFVPVRDQFSAVTYVPLVEKFNNLYTSKTDFTEEQFAKLPDEYKYHLAGALRCKLANITYENFLEYWPWESSICTSSYSVKALARTIFCARNSARRDHSQSILDMRGDIRMVLPNSAVHVYRNAELDSPKISKHHRSQLRSIWLPKLPRPRVLTLGRGSQNPLVCKLKGPKCVGHEVSFRIQNGAECLGAINFCVGRESVSVSKIAIPKHLQDNHDQILYALLDVASEAALLNYHSQGRVELALGLANDFSSKLLAFGYTQTLDREIETLNLSGKRQVVRLSMYCFETGTAHQWGKNFYAEELQGALSLMISGRYPYDSDSHLDQFTHAHSVLEPLIRNLNCLLPESEHLNRAFEAKVNSYYCKHARNRTEELHEEVQRFVEHEDRMFYSESPLILYIAIYRALCEISGAPVHPSVTDEMPHSNFRVAFDAIKHIHLSSLLRAPQQEVVGA
ncbi:MAG: hypothetical protein S4CHLAM37_07490 [Chlamydiia bacterium]|nr:hypothetical protein [Chlamydiia bacterium]